MKWIKSQSMVRPEEVDTLLSKKVVYLRRNIVESQIKDEITGDTYTVYNYDEAKMTKEEYKDYLKGLAIIDIEQQRADIDYLAIMTGVEL